MKGRRLRYALAALAVLVLLALAAPRIVEAWWRVRSANPVRRGVALARDLGCFSCHGELGGSGIADPGAAGESVPGWSGGVWMMYVKDDDDIRDFIRFGSAGRAADGQDHANVGDHEHPGITMPGYDSDLSGSDLDDLVAAFRVLSGMSRPAVDTPARAGYDLARDRDCFSCHGPAASGGLPNPRSFTGFIPGWYGRDFGDLVQSREEFDGWIRHGGVPRIADHPVGGWFQRRQRITMPAYVNLSAADLDRLWAYAEWLRENDGGAQGPIHAF